MGWKWCEWAWIEKVGLGWLWWTGFGVKIVQDPFGFCYNKDHFFNLAKDED